jgi:hypothetical protein
MMNDFEYNGSSELERYLSGAMSPEEARTFARRAEHDGELRSMIEADRMIRRVVDGDLRSLPPSPAGSRARIAETARSAPRYAPPVAAAEKKNGAAKKWITTIIGLGIMIAVGVMVERGTDVPDSAVGAATAHGDTLGRTDTATTSRRTQPSAPAASPHEVRATTAQRRGTSSTTAPDAAAQAARNAVSSGTQAKSDGSSRTTRIESPSGRTVLTDTATRSIQNDSAHAPLTISPAKINRPAKSDGKP